MAETATDTVRLFGIIAHQYPYPDNVSSAHRRKYKELATKIILSKMIELRWIRPMKKIEQNNATTTLTTDGCATI